MKTLNKKTITIIAILLIIVIFLIFRTFQNKGASIAYKTAKVDKGDIISYVTATGTLNPISTVEIGSQVSGTIKNTFVDFNSVVKKGDPLAEIDPTPFNSQLKQAQADLNKAEADAEIAKNLQRANEELYKKRLISKEEYDDSRAKYSSAIATLEQRKAALEIAKANPIFGTGVETFAYSYYQYRPVEHNNTSEWDFLYNKAHNEYLNYLATTGIVGFVSYISIIVMFLFWNVKRIGFLKTLNTF
ncbi:MAG: efflux transporter, family, subunit [Candidatus Dadabacteria bacterium]|nr:efflux transporter, family, subunit [Candidatus Dadabacteria bacterium]